MTPEELAKIATIERETRATFEHSLNVCTAAGCLSLHSDQLKAALETEVKQRGLDGHCKVRGVGCMGLCAAGPLVSVEPAGVMYQAVKPSDAGEIVERVESQPIERLRCPTDVPFFTRQKKIVLENTGRIDPERVEEYIAFDGYKALLDALTTMSPQQVIEQIMRSGLRSGSRRM